MMITHLAFYHLVSNLRKDHSDWGLTIEIETNEVELRKPKKKFQIVKYSIFLKLLLRIKISKDISFYILSYM